MFYVFFKIAKINYVSSAKPKFMYSRMYSRKKIKGEERRKIWTNLNFIILFDI